MPDNSQDDSDHCEDESQPCEVGEPADASKEVAQTSPISRGRRRRRPLLIDPAVVSLAKVLPPLVDPTLFSGIAPLPQAAEIARMVAAPITQNLNLHLTASMVLAWATTDLTPLLSAIELTPFIPKTDFSSWMPGLRALLEDFGRHEPPNWPADLDFDRAVEVICDDGLPLVWVPRAELVQEVVDADDRRARVAVLLAHRPALVADCRAVLREVTHPVLTGQQQLAGRCVEAFEQGHDEAAQALAVAVTETAVSRALRGNYAKVKQQVLFDPDLVPFTQLRLRAALAPIHRFYTDWSPQSPYPAPEAVSRHVTVHHADPSHYTEANSLIAVLLACSLLRALQELQQLAEASGLDREMA